RVRRDVEVLTGQNAGAGISGHVAHRVTAALARGQAGVAELADERGGVGQRHVVHLDVLARGDVALAQRDVLLDAVGEGVELVGRDAAERQLDADHLDIGLALPVDALLEAELDEGVLLEVALEKSGGLGVEVVELPLEDRDHVAGDVLDHLRVVQRSGTRCLRVDRCWLHAVLPSWEWSRAANGRRHKVPKPDLDPPFLVDGGRLGPWESRRAEPVAGGGRAQRSTTAVWIDSASITLTVTVWSTAEPWCLPFFFLALTSVRAGTVTRSEALRTGVLRNVTTRLPPRSAAVLLRRWPDALRTVIPRERSRARLAKRIWLDGTTTIERIGGASVPAPTLSDSCGRPFLTVSPPVIVGRPATIQAMAASVVEPDASVTVMVVL